MATKRAAKPKRTRTAIQKTAPIAPKWSWTLQKERAAILLAEDRQSDDEIAAEIGISARSINIWKKVPAFATRIETLVDQRRKRMLRYRIARDEELMADLQADYDRHEQVRAERAADPAMADIPGGTTGVMLRKLKVIGVGRSQQTVEEYEEDANYYRTRLLLQDQARKLLGKDIKRVALSFDVRKEAERLAGELGLTAEQVMKEAGLLEAGVIDG